LHAPPGAFWNYSNPGFSLAGLVAERASGIPFRELLHTRIFDAAGMSASTLDSAEVLASGNFTYGHPMDSTDETEVYVPGTFESWVGAPAGQAFSTASDLARWAQLLMDGGGAVLSETSTEAMQRRQVYLDYIPDFHYGLGIFAETYKGMDVRQHGGNLVGWGALMLWVPEERFVVSILGNTLMHLGAAAYCIVDAVLEPGPVPPADYSTDPATWDRYTGRYSFMDAEGNHFEAEVSQEDERLFITFDVPGEPGPYKTELEQFFLDTFVFDWDGEIVLHPLLDPTFIIRGLTFIHRGAPDGTTRWLRSQSYVGKRMIPPRRSTGRRAPG
jgi:CubicO group peptidase (beta-lactamase class C family)